MDEVPVIDVAPLLDGSDVSGVAGHIDAACRASGFFAVAGHGADPGPLETAARAFFALPDDEKASVAMVRAGRRWRGWFPVGGELTSGRPDHKEGLYFGQELPLDDPRVEAGRPLHGPNLFPPEPAGLRSAVLDWMSRMGELARHLMGALAVGLGLERDHFDRELTAEPTVLFRIFHYPPVDEPAGGWP